MACIASASSGTALPARRTAAARAVARDRERGGTQTSIRWKLSVKPTSEKPAAARQLSFSATTVRAIRTRACRTGRSQAGPGWVPRWGSSATAEKIVVWDSGALREFLHVNDLADALVFLMDRYSDLGHVNVGSGAESPSATSPRWSATSSGSRARSSGTPPSLRGRGEEGYAEGFEAERVGRGRGGGGWRSTRPRNKRRTRRG
uniref:NAD-dependent epimerase/dehydratase domain-containing protein n=1 Tax=Ananas comosus var. bracteatus TaxID=296719 RepID=A0A6V7PMP1_ANACO|nr:unnamed protein product [Ananas comosus var. bracteatus]